MRGVRTVDIASAGYPLKFAFGGAAKGANPYVNIINRLQVIQFEDFDGRLRTLAYEPTVPEGPVEAPFYAQMVERLGEFLSYKVLATIWNHPDEALGGRAAPRGRGLRQLRPPPRPGPAVRARHHRAHPGRGGAPPAVVPEREADRPAREWDTFGSLHPMQWAWYVEDGLKDLITDNVVLVNGDVELGKGVALVWTPGHTDGNHSLCINTDDGVWVSSENGVAADSWHPHLSKIPGSARRPSSSGAR